SKDSMKGKEVEKDILAIQRETCEAQVNSCQIVTRNYKCGRAVPYTLLKDDIENTDCGINHKCNQCDYQTPKIARLKRHVTIVHLGIKTINAVNVIIKHPKGIVLQNI
ncbi:hypothetical protein HHI36_021685, partial [Cryptolaemus montrouzieri]